MIQYHVFDIVYGRKRREELLAAFLEDTRTVNKIMKEDMVAEYLERIRRGVDERYIT